MPHSEGPWFTMDGTVVSDHDGTVCHMEKSNPDRVHNARLIAAAPTLLDALQTVADALAGTLPDIEYESILDAIAEAIGTN